MTHKVLETLRQCIADADDNDFPVTSEAGRAQALAWLDAFEKHAPAIHDLIEEGTLHDEQCAGPTDCPKCTAADWLESTTKDEDT